MALPVVTSSVDEIALEFVDQVYRDVTAGWLSTFAVDRTSGERHVDWAPVADKEILAATALDRSATCDVWIGVATRTANLGNRRGGVTDCAELPALFADIDIAGPNHKITDGLPADLEAAHALLASFPVPPTVVVATGGGLQPWWLLAEPLPVDDVTLALLASWGATWAQLAARRSLRVDNVFNADRILRLPGTVNRKNDPTTVTIVEAAWERRYGVDDLEPHLIAPPVPPACEPRRSIPYIGPERPGDAFDARHTGGEVLGWLGFTHARTEHNGDEHWVRPDKDAREGTSATVYAEDGHVTVWSDTVAAQYPALEVRRPYDPYGLWVATKHGGDFSAASSELRHRGYGSVDVDPASLIATIPTETVDQPRASSLALRWLPDTFTSPPEQPANLVRGLLRAGEMCAMAAPRAIGKSWFAMNLAVLLGQGEGQLAGALEIVRPAKVLYAHGELDEYSAYERWFRMCAAAPPAGVAESFERWRLRTVNRRTTSSSDGVAYSDEHVDAIVDPRLEATIAEHGIEVLVIDPWAVFYAGKENSNDETEAALDKLRDLSLRYGLAVVIVHHISAKTQPGHLAEPEDLWRGATRLADWASTRVTILRHFTDDEVEERQLTRQEARRFVDVKILRRGEPTPDFSMRMNFSTGWWEPWYDESRITEAKLTPEGIAQRCREAGGFESLRQAGAYLDVDYKTAQPVLDRAVVLGLLRTEPAARNATRYLPIEDS